MGADYIVSVDLGQASDFTAVGGFRRIPVATGKTKELYINGGVELTREYEDTFSLGYAHRFPLHTPYPDQVSKLADICGRIPGTYQIVADATGVGRPVLDIMRSAGLPVIGVIITAGASNAQQDKDSGYWKVPKRELITRAQSYMQSGKLKIASKLALADVIVKEMLAFKMKVASQSGNVSFEAWRESAHDDLVLMLCMGVWWGHQTRTAWKKDRGPHRELDTKMREAAREYFDEGEKEW